MTRFVLIFVLILMASVTVGVVFANGLAGERLEKVVGDQIVDIGTNQTSTAVAGEPIQFDFNLLRSDTRDPLPNTNVMVDIGQDGKSLINSDLISEQPVTLLVYTFPEAGKYTLTVTFYDKSRMPQELATASFPLTISGSTITTRALYVAALFASMIVGFCGGYWRGLKPGAVPRAQLAGD
jgi:hypothetical protein